MSSKSQFARKQIAIDLCQEEMSKVHKELSSKAPVLCRTCNRRYKFIVVGGELEPCPFCRQKEVDESKKEEGEKEMQIRAEFYRNKRIQPGKSFADIFKK